MSFVSAMIDSCPPWLRRRFGRGVVGGIGDSIDVLFQRAVSALRLRFPDASAPAALAAIGAERQIAWGPGEESTTYAARLRTWLDSHRTRGGAFSLLTQLHLYFRSSLEVPMEVVGNSGVRHLVDAEGQTSRDELVGFGGDGSDSWARLWIMVHLESAFLPMPVVKASGEPVLAADGMPLVDLVDVFSLGPEHRSRLLQVVSDWLAAHVECAHVVLFHSGLELWDYAAPERAGESIGMWDNPSDATWQTEDPTVVGTCELGMNNAYTSAPTVYLVTEDDLVLVTETGEGIAL